MHLKFGFEPVKLSYGVFLVFLLLQLFLIYAEAINV